MEELTTYVIYDIEDDHIRNRIAEACKDYGLMRIQYSAFSGMLTRNKSNELFLRLKKELGKKQGKILVQPVCQKDVKNQYKFENLLEEDDHGTT
jgi:CRISPR-associated protein Cas2